MQWLISQMWILLAVAGVLGLILGLALRGLMSGGKMRRATVERDVARTELSQARAEIDALYASQRKMKEEGVVTVDTSAVDGLRAELAERDEQITDLQMSLQSARDDLEAAKSDDTNTLQTAGAAVAGAAAGALLGGGDDDKVKELEERNTWLEERVAALESDIEAEGATSAAVAVETADPTSEPEQTGPSLAKLEWQNTYLRQRVEALEEQMHVAPITTTDLSAEPEPTVEDEMPQEDAGAVAESEEELARLRWRNRYLEGRLAYYEEGAGSSDNAAAELVSQTDDEPEEDDDNKTGLIAASVAGAGALAAAAVLSDEADAQEEDDAEPSEDTTTEQSGEIETSEAEAGIETPEEVDLAEDQVEASDDATEEPPEESQATESETSEVEAIEAEETETEGSEETDAEEAEETASEDTVDIEAKDLTEETGEETETPSEEEHPSDAVLRTLDEAETTEASEESDPDKRTPEATEEVVTEEPTDEMPADDEDAIPGVQPEAMPAPSNSGDDLTKIGGIGPRISEVLNGLGIWTYVQIADWTPENAAWIEEHLSFKGRVSREQWIEQAKVLVEADSASSD